MRLKRKKRLQKNIVFPKIFDLKKPNDKRRLEKLKKNKKVLNVSNDFLEQEQELFEIQNPIQIFKQNKQATFKKFLKNRERLFGQSDQRGKWIYYPWNASLVHILEEREFLLVRTARNQLLITPEEQKKFYYSTIGIGGLSVGSSIALAIVLQGGGRNLKLADHDRLALSNTNRIRTGIQELGELKTHITARQIFEINPYAKIEFFNEGLNENNLAKFFKNTDIVIDEIDNLAIKLLIRKYAKKYRLPVLMGADNADSAVIDVERYDLKPKPKFFHGRLGNVSYNELSKLDKLGTGKMITKLIGFKNITERMQKSLTEIGKSIVSWPQLGGAAMLNGAAVAYCARKILNKQPITNNRAIISLDEKLQSTILIRKKEGNKLKNTLGL